MYNLNKAAIKLIGFFVTVLLLTVATYGQEKTDTTKMNHMKHNSMKMNHSMMDSTKQNSIVREEPIDLKAIDENGDGKVFQDMMDWNVISDKAGECPLCGMKLKEVSLNEAKVNLISNGFEVK
ncbi:MAG: hypothetical protein K8F36_12200 [Melioribacteraceae bacterium]|jgi:hypothetical protein|nr:hypothetical protein [Melioribacteraceae bacterium]